MEITRFDLLSVYHQVHGRIKTTDCELLTNEKKQRFVVMLRQLSCGSPMNSDKEKSAREILRETQQCMTGLCITERERVEIVSAMAMGQGHWFKCPNGMCLFIKHSGNRGPGRWFQISNCCVNYRLSISSICCGCTVRVDPHILEMDIRQGGRDRS